jgi:hypothetical protein
MSNNAQNSKGLIFEPVTAMDAMVKNSAQI